jgi:putative ABC transport system permease protein
VTTPSAVPANVADQVAHVGGLETPVDLSCKWTALTGDAAPNQYLHVCRYDSAIHQVAVQFPQTMPDDQLWSGEDAGVTAADQNSYDLAGRAVTLAGTAGPVGLTAATQNVAQAHGSTQVDEALYHTGWTFVSPTVYDKLAGSSIDRAMVIARVAAGADTMSVYNALQTATGGDSATVIMGGSLGEKYMIDQVMSILVGTMTVLLAVAVLIALVGVSNTLTLSVIERSRESAILRAVGAQKRQLRAMMLIEALLLTVTGAIIGAVAGGYFGWLGAKAMVQQFRGEGFVMNVQFAIDWPQTLGLLAILVIAAALASLLPGRRAAKASPVAALAEV